MSHRNEAPFTNPHDTLLQHIDRASAMANFAIATRFSELDDAVIFGYFETLADILCQTRKIADSL